MTDDFSDLVLEGNSAVTLLQELFACDITVARTQCEACCVGTGLQWEQF
jgi:hypothetical protein